jgi:hypothetical protein
LTNTHSSFLVTQHPHPPFCKYAIEQHAASIEPALDIANYHPPTAYVDLFAAALFDLLDMLADDTAVLSVITMPASKRNQRASAKASRRGATKSDF